MDSLTLDHRNKLATRWALTLLLISIMGVFMIYKFSTASESQASDESSPLTALEPSASPPSATETIQAPPPTLSPYKLKSIERGEWLYKQHCLACHDREGKGLVGPNLTDWHFIYGSSKRDLLTIITDGKEDRGMPAWEKHVSRSELFSLTEYVWSLRGTMHPEGTPPLGHFLSPDQR